MAAHAQGQPRSVGAYAAKHTLHGIFATRPSLPQVVENTSRKIYQYLVQLGACPFLVWGCIAELPACFACQSV